MRKKHSHQHRWLVGYGPGTHQPFPGRILFIFVFRNPRNRCMMGTKVGKVRVRPQKHNRIHRYPWTKHFGVWSYGIFSLRAEMDGFLKNPNRPCPFYFSEVRRFHCGNIEGHCKKRNNNHRLYVYPWNLSFMESFMVVVDMRVVIYAWDSSTGSAHPINPVWKSRMFVCRFSE